MRKKIEYLANHYSKKEQYEKAMEEVTELEDELYRGTNPLGDPNLVYLTGNTWSECADVIIMIAQLAIQHNKEDEIQQQMEYKLDRQLKRIGQQDWKRRVMNTFLGGREFSGNPCTGCFGAANNDCRICGYGGGHDE